MSMPGWFVEVPTSPARGNMFQYMKANNYCMFQEYPRLPLRETGSPIPHSIMKASIIMCSKIWVYTFYFYFLTFPAVNVVPCWTSRQIWSSNVRYTSGAGPIYPEGEGKPLQCQHTGHHWIKFEKKNRQEDCQYVHDEVLCIFMLTAAAHCSCSLTVAHSQLLTHSCSLTVAHLQLLTYSCSLTTHLQLLICSCSLKSLMSPAEGNSWSFLVDPRPFWKETDCLLK